jgi:hypothetical protein
MFRIATIAATLLLGARAALAETSGDSLAVPVRVAPATQESQPFLAGDVEQFFAAYSPVWDYSIFQRERGPVEMTPAPVAAARPPLSDQQKMIVTGIVSVLGERFVYVEDVSAGTTLRIRAGGTVAGGTVAEIVMNRIAFEREGRREWISAGQDFTGSPVVSVTQRRIQGAAERTLLPSDETLEINVDN